MMNLIYRHNEDGSLKKSFEMKKVYVITVVSLVMLYTFNVNPYFNNELDSFLAALGLNIWALSGFFIVVGYLVFNLSHKLDKTLKPIQFNQNH